MQIDIDKAIELMEDTNADSAEYKLEREIENKKYNIKITIESQQWCEF